MPLVKALKTFRGKYGMIRAGTTFNSDPRYAAALEKKGWLKTVGGGEPEPLKPPEPKPGSNRNVPQAPGRAGKDSAAGKAGAALPPTAPLSNRAVLDTRKGSARPPAAGKGAPSRSLRADLPPPAKTSKPSGAGDSKSSSRAGSVEMLPPESKTLDPADFEEMDEGETAGE
jgi:hypothetical protein